MRRLKINNYKKKKPSFLGDFKRALKEVDDRNLSLAYGYSDYDSWDDYYSYRSMYGAYSDEYDEDAYWDRLRDLREKYSVKDSKKKDRKERKNPIYKDIDDTHGNKNKKKKYDKSMSGIYYYRDVNNPDVYEYFDNLYEFDDFLENNNIYVSDYELQQLIHREISHCCIRPSSLKSPKYLELDSSLLTPTLISDSSYGGLRWSCAEDDDELY